MCGSQYVDLLNQSSCRVDFKTSSGHVGSFHTGTPQLNQEHLQGKGGQIPTLNSLRKIERLVMPRAANYKVINCEQQMDL